MMGQGCFDEMTVRTHFRELRVGGGAAYLADLAVGFWEDQAEISSHWRAGRRYEPGMKVEEGGRKSKRVGLKYEKIHAALWAACKKIS